jgi:hypothetical protein
VAVPFAEQIRREADLYESAELLDCQCPRFALALGRALYVNEIHGVNLKWDQTPPHRPIKENVHHAAHVPFALWGEVEGLNPFLNGKRLDLRERNISEYVVGDSAGKRDLLYPQR